MDQKVNIWIFKKLQQSCMTSLFFRLGENARWLKKVAQKLKKKILLLLLLLLLLTNIRQPASCWQYYESYESDVVPPRTARSLCTACNTPYRARHQLHYDDAVIPFPRRAPRVFSVTWSRRRLRARDPEVTSSPFDIGLRRRTVVRQCDNDDRKWYE